MLQKSNRRAIRRPTEFTLKKTRPTGRVLYAQPVINPPRRTMIPGPVNIGPTSSGPDPLLAMIDRAERSRYRRLLISGIDAGRVRRGRGYSVAGVDNSFLSGIDEIQKSPYFPYAIIAFGTWLFWDSLKKL
jgi:hypothetical protein